MAHSTGKHQRACVANLSTNVARYKKKTLRITDTIQSFCATSQCVNIDVVKLNFFHTIALPTYQPTTTTTTIASIYDNKLYAVDYLFVTVTMAVTVTVTVTLLCFGLYLHLAHSARNTFISGVKIDQDEEKRRNDSEICVLSRNLLNSPVDYDKVLAAYSLKCKHSDKSNREVKIVLLTDNIDVGINILTRSIGVIEEC
uniref:Uncharacterized protein n=1 Tax=Glossina brevipalpis TaxID=37001 RepID=A0A1A9X4G5_9MUSC